MDKNEQGIKFMQEHKYEEAAKVFNDVIDENPTEPIGYINFGNLLLHLKEYNRSISFFRKAIELNSEALAAYYGLGNVYFEQSQFAAAQESFQQAISLGLEDADVYFMLGITLQNQEQSKLALPFLLRAVELSPEDEEFLFQYGLSLAQGNFLKDAKVVFEKILSINENHPDAHYNLGVIDLFNENVESAEKHFDEAIRIQPDHLLAVNGKKTIETFKTKE